MEGEIPSMMIELYNYVQGEHKGREFISNGKYRPRIMEKDFTIYESDTDDTIKAKI